MLVAAVFAANLVFARPERFSLFLLASCVLSFGSETDGLGTLANLSALWLLCLIALSLLAIGRFGRGGLSWSPAEICYALFLGWCVLESLRAADLSYALRAFLRLSFPFLSMYLARRSIQAEATAEQLLGYQLRMTCASGLICCGMIVLPALFGLIVQIIWFGAVFFDHAAIVSMLALAVWSRRRDLKSLLVALFLVALCIRAVNRTTMMALTVGASIFCLLEFRKLAVLLLPALYTALLAVLLLVPAFRDKMFYAPDKVDGSALSNGELDSKQINNNGRFAMWDTVLSRFFKPSPLMGSGLGSTQAWFYSGAAKEAGCGDLRVEHSEYVRLLSDTGLIGATLFVLSVGVAGLDAGRALRRARQPMGHAFAVAAICAGPVFLVCMGFDNALLYVIPVAQLPFALSAIASRLSVASQTTQPAMPHATLETVRWLPLQPLRRPTSELSLHS
jgi:hypothetical protein